MKAIDILDVLSRECVGGENFGVIHLIDKTNYAYFVRHYLSIDYEATLEEASYFLRGAVFYCWSSCFLDFPISDDIHVHEIGGEYLYVIKTK